MANKIRYVTSDGNIEYADAPLIKPIDVAGEEGFGVYHSPIIVTPNGVYKSQHIKPRFFSEGVADQRDAAEIRRKQTDEKVKQMFSGKEYAKLGGLTLAGSAAAGLGAAGLGYLSTLPGTVAGNFIGDIAGSMALGMGLEEGQRVAFGRSAGDIVYSQLKPYIGEFGANMARPEYIISPSMVLKNTYTQATNNLGRQFERETARLLKPINKKDRLALRRNTLAVVYDPEYKKLVESPTTTYLDITNHLNRQQDKFLNLQKAISGVERALAKSQETSAKAKDIEELKVLARQYGDLQRKILSDEKILNQYNTKTAGAIVDNPKFRAEIEVPNNSPRFQLGSGPGLNHTTGYSPLQQSITGIRPFYISYNPKNIESFSDFINQYKRIYQNPLIDRDRQFYHDSLDGISQASERIINLSKQMDIPIYKGNANKSYSFLGSLFPKQEGDLYAILNSQNPEFGSGLTYLYGKNLFPTNNFTLIPDRIYNNSSELAQSILKNFNIEGYLNSSGQVNWRRFTLDLQRAYPNSSVTFYTDKNNWRGYSDAYKKSLIRQLDTKYKQRRPLKRDYYKKKEELKRTGAFTREANNTENLTRVLHDLQVRANKIKSTVLSPKESVNKMNASISYRDPNYKTSDLFNRFFAQQKINGTEFDKYGTIANYSRGVPEHIKSYINQNTVERAAIAMRKAGYSEREIQQYIEKVNTEMDNVKYGMYSNKDYKDAGFGDFAGFYNDDNNFISVNKESPNFTPDEVFKHEVRHLVDYRTSMTDEMYNILDDAYDKDFLEIPKHENAGSLKDYPYMDREKVTTNLDARNALFKDKNLTWVLDKNSYAEHTKPRKPRTIAEFLNPPKREYPEDMIEFQNLLIQQAQPEDIVKAVENSNGYGRRYIEYLRETGKLTPEKIEQFRKALMYVPSYVLPAAGGYKLLKSQQLQNQK